MDTATAYWLAAFIILVILFIGIIAIGWRLYDRHENADNVPPMDDFPPRFEDGKDDEIEDVFADWDYRRRNDKSSRHWFD